MRPHAILTALNAVQQGQRGALMPWAAVAFGSGVALYYELPAEPAVLGYAAAGGAGCLALLLYALRREVFGPLALGVALLSAGLLAAGLRSHEVAGHVLDFRYYGPVEGRIVGIDRSASDALRLTLDEVRLDDVAPGRTPLRVRVALHGAQDWLDPEPGARVMMTAHLSPPSGPAEPGGFDFQRHSWFLSIGAVGYTRTPVLLAEARAPGAAALFHLRMRMSEGIRAAIPGQPGAFAAAVLTGDRSGLEAGPVEDMRDANIAHLLAISGLHMGLLTGVVYGGLRLALALVPYLALRYPIRKWAAAGALCAAAFYLALSGGNVATERAFIQVAVMLCAVMLDRRAITLRSVAIAALIVLAHRPETLFSPGFQMSFAATAALVAVFNGLRGAEWLRARPGWQKWLFALMMSSIVAGAATAPYAAAHFNRVSVYGLAANLLTVPVMGSLIIPAAVVAAILWPLGLSWLAFAVMEPGLIWTLEVARRVSDLPGAVDFVPNPPPGTLGLVSAGGVLLILWRGRGRWTGLAPLALAGALWTGGERPAVLVSDTGGLVGVMTEEGRALSRPRGDGFVAGIWLENDGDRATQEEAAARPGWVPDGAGMSIETGDLRIWHGAGRRALADAARACADHDLLVLSEPLEGAEPVPEGARPGSRVALAPEGAAPTVPLSHPAAQPPGPARPASPAMAASAAPVAGCMILDPVHLAGTGAVAIAAGGGRFTIRTARETQGTRLWTPDP